MFIYSFQVQALISLTNDRFGGFTPVNAENLIKRSNFQITIKGSNAFQKSLQCKMKLLGFSVLLVIIIANINFCSSYFGKSLDENHIKPNSLAFVSSRDDNDTNIIVSPRRRTIQLSIIGVVTAALNFGASLINFGTAATQLYTEIRAESNMKEMLAAVKDESKEIMKQVNEKHEKQMKRMNEISVNTILKLNNIEGKLDSVTGQINAVETDVKKMLFLMDYHWNMTSELLTGLNNNMNRFSDQVSDETFHKNDG